MSSAAERLIVAFDAQDLHETLRLARRLRGLVSYAKIGSILFTTAGPVAVARVRALGFRTFLDLKFHDIPSTVEKSCRAATHHGVSMLTVHASGGREMLEAAVAGVREEAARLRVQRPRVVGVTVLTSVGASDARAMTAQVVALAREAKRAGLDGVVASAQEAAAIRRALPRPFLIVCPGIRPASADASDHHRVATPGRAVSQGADFLVVGRPITEAKEPREVIRRIVAEIRQRSHEAATYGTK